MVRVLFRSKALRDRCRSSAAMKGFWGAEAAAVLRRRLQQLAAASNPDDLAFLPCRVIDDENGQRRLPLHGQLTLVISHESGSDEADAVPNLHSIVVEDICEMKSNVQ